MTLASKIKRGVLVLLIMVTASVVGGLINNLPLSGVGGILLRAVLSMVNLTAGIYFACRVLGVWGPLGAKTSRPNNDGGG